jgi:Transposase, Mutator family
MSCPLSRTLPACHDSSPSIDIVIADPAPARRPPTVTRTATRRQVNRRTAAPFDPGQGPDQEDDAPVAGLRQAIVEVLSEAAWQRCYVHFLHNALDYVPRKVDHDCLRELRWLYDRRDLAEARRDLAAWLAKWRAAYPKLCGWVEEHIEETLSF